MRLKFRECRVSRLPAQSPAVSPASYRSAVPTIAELDAAGWPDEAGASTSFLVRRCLELRHKELAAFTVEDLRIMLGQRIAVEVLLPLAVAVLLETPDAEGDYYPGDLLVVVARLPRTVWADRPDEHRALAAAARSLLPHLPSTTHADLQPFIDSAPPPSTR
jgi:hypothetical protein